VTITDTTTDDVRVLDERESNGVRVTLVWTRASNRASVLVSDERSGAAFSLEVRGNESPLDVFHHPFAYDAHRRATTQAASPLAA
jgi:hypothetical protein